MKDPFLGAWAVHETVFAPDGKRLGMVAQERRLHRLQDGTEAVRVEQTCRPGPELAGHAMAAFAGDFVFRLEPRGQQRLYQGPDVVGCGTSIGGGFLAGRGVWPRFGFNFRSWSVALDAGRQLTGGVFYRGAETVAVVVGYGVLMDAAGKVDSARPTAPHWQSFRTAPGSGVLHNRCAANGNSSTLAIHRQLHDTGSWTEWSDAFEHQYNLSARAANASSGGEPGHKSHAGDEHGGAAWAPCPTNEDTTLSSLQITRGPSAAPWIGMAKAYGPLLCWELHDGTGAAVEAIDITDPDGSRQFSLRHNYQQGRLVETHGLQFTL